MKENIPSESSHLPAAAAVLTTSQTLVRYGAGLAARSLRYPAFVRNRFHHLPGLRSARLLLSALTCALAVPSGFAATYYVATTGLDTNVGSLASPFKTIQKGVNTAVGGDTVYVRGGTYVQTVNINTAAGSTIVVSGYASETVIVDGQDTLPTAPDPLNPDDPKYRNLVHIARSNVELRNMTVKRSVGRGVSVDAPSGSSVSNVLVYNIDANYNWNSGIIVTRGDTVTVQNCKVWQNARSNAGANRGLENWPGALVMADSNHSLAKGCAIYQNHGENLCDLRCDNSVFEDNVSWDSYKINIYRDNSQYITLRRNLVYSTDDTEFWRYGAAGGPSPGIVVTNERYDNHQNYNTGSQIYNNAVYNNGTAFGIWNGGGPASSFTNMLVAYNTFASTRTGTIGGLVKGISITSSAMTNVLIKNNIIQYSAGTLATGPTTGSTFSYDNWSAAVSGGFSNANDVIGNAALALGTGTPNLNWFKLTSTSPAINEAQAITEVTTDAFNTTRGSAPDMGIHEYAGALPSPWLSSDYGAVGVPGSASESGGTFTVQGSGTGMTGTADEFRYVYQSASGDCTIIAKVFSINSSAPAAAQVGMMVRDSLATNSKHASLFVTKSNGITMTRRFTTGQTTYSTATTGLVAPYWLKIQRVASTDTFTLSRSPDNTTWTVVGTTVVPMASNVFIGLAVSNTTDGTLCTGTFTNVTVTP